MKGKSKGAHEWLIEFKTFPGSIANFAQLLDLELQKLNSDYEAKRYNNMTLSPLILHTARPQLFYDWLKAHDKLGGNIKFQGCLMERKHLDELLQMNVKN